MSHQDHQHDGQPQYRPGTDPAPTHAQPGPGQPSFPPQPSYQGYPSSSGHSSHPDGQQYLNPYATPGHGAAPPAADTTRSSRRAPWIAVPLAALLAAGLASAGTYALTADDTPAAAGTAAGGRTTVIDADPADFADAGSINWSATASKVSPSVVSIRSSSGQGSGVVLDAAGNIVTNNHVVAGEKNLQVSLSDNRAYPATIVGTDPSTDLAVVRITNVPRDLKPIQMGDANTLVVGQPVMAVGNPLGLSGTVTTGIVSALDRPVSTQESNGEDQAPGLPGIPGQSQTQDGARVVTNAIQTSAAINPGNSGGALVSGSGTLIGINSSIASLSGASNSSQSGNIGIGFAIPVTVVKSITGQLIKSGKAQHAQLGVSATNGSVEQGGATLSGAKVAAIQPNSGASGAGLKTGDVIVSIDDEPVESSTSLVGQVRERSVGQRVKLSVVRDGKAQNLTVTLGAAPATT